jgi:hypothetical protein
MVYFQTKNPTLGKFLGALYRKMLIYLMDVWNILRTFGKIYDKLVHLVLIRNTFPVLVSRTKKNLATLQGMLKKSLSTDNLFFASKRFQ